MHRGADRIMSGPRRQRRARRRVAYAIPDVTPGPRRAIANNAAVSRVSGDNEGTTTVRVRATRRHLGIVDETGGANARAGAPLRRALDAGLQQPQRAPQR
jgi:hypothetical protein